MDSKKYLEDYDSITPIKFRKERESSNSDS